MKKKIAKKKAAAQNLQEGNVKQMYYQLFRRYSISVYLILPEDGCQQSFLRYRSLDVKVNSLHN